MPRVDLSVSGIAEGCKGEACSCEEEGINRRARNRSQKETCGGEYTIVSYASPTTIVLLEKLNLFEFSSGTKTVKQQLLW